MKFALDLARLHPPAPPIAADRAPTWAEELAAEIERGELVDADGIPIPRAEQPPL